MIDQNSTMKISSRQTDRVFLSLLLYCRYMVKYVKFLHDQNIGLADCIGYLNYHSTVTKNFKQITRIFNDFLTG